MLDVVAESVCCLTWKRFDDWCQKL